VIDLATISSADARRLRQPKVEVFDFISLVQICETTESKRLGNDSPRSHRLSIDEAHLAILEGSRCEGIGPPLDSGEFS
jgi:hypothetical protein